MIIVNRIGENITVSCRDKEFNVMYSVDKFEQLMKISESSNTVKTLDELNVLLESVEGICKNDYKEKIEAFHPELYVQPATKQFYLKIGQAISSIAIPEPLVRRLEESVDKGIDISPIVKCWKRFLRNKKANQPAFATRFASYINMTYINPAIVTEKMEAGLSEELAREAALTYEVKITQEGLIACYKTSNELEVKFVGDEYGELKQVSRFTKRFNEDTGEVEGDNRDDIDAEARTFVPYMMGTSGDAFYCEGPLVNKLGHIIKIGHVHRLEDWSQVNCNDDASCVKGLHLGGLSYIASWNGADIHTCFVDPMHIGAIPDYSGDKAIRVIQYFVYGSLVALNHGIYHSSSYAAKTDEEWDKINAHIIKSHGELVESIQQASTETISL
jgi:hypothetical protein